MSAAPSSFTSGGTPAQIKFLVQQGCVPPMLELLAGTDLRIVRVALDGLENIMEHERKVKHSKLADKTLKAITDPAAIEVKLKAENLIPEGASSSTPSHGTPAVSFDTKKSTPTAPSTGVENRS